MSGTQILEFDISMVCIAYGASRKPSSGQVAAQADWDEWYLRSDYAAKSESDPNGRAAKQHEDVRKILLELLGVDDLRVAGLDQRRPNDSIWSSRTRPSSPPDGRSSSTLPCTEQGRVSAELERRGAAARLLLARLRLVQPRPSTRAGARRFACWSSVGQR